MRMGFVDIHTHILPRIDDGSRDIEMTMAMLKEEQRQGAGAVVLTPHFYADRNQVDRFLEKRKASLETLEAALKGAMDGDAPKLFLGAEAAFFRGISKAERLPDLCIREIDAEADEGIGQSTNAILIEMPFVQWTKETADEIEEIACGRRMKVVLAHIERYMKYQKDKSAWNRVMDLPIVTQINAGSFLKDMRKRRTCLKWIKAAKGSRIGSVIGSDCHNLDSRRPNMAEAREVIAKKAGNNVLDEMDRTAEQVLGIE